jgi:diguanylate cyclase (GGDEF)-like protein/PAS domain S-box-containing protein
MTFGAGSQLRAAFAFRRPREDDALYRHTFAEAPVAAALVSPDGRFIEVNQALVSLLGYGDGQLAPTSLAGLTPPGDLPLRLEDLDRTQRERCIMGADGEPMWVAVSAATIEGAISLVQIENIADRKRAERKLRRLADHDALTWLLNRRCFLEGMHREVQRMRSGGVCGALLLLDLDNFKEVNDTSGHPAGDSVLRSTADVLRRRLRSSDVIGRLGGDEFAALLLEVTPDQAQDVADDLTRLLSDLEIEASVGVAGIDEYTTETDDELLARADRAMYATKTSRRS